MEAIYHIPAMLKETIEGLAIKPGGVYVDVTFGGGGHSREILKNLTPTLPSREGGKPHPTSPQGEEIKEGGHLYSFDQDIEAYENAKKIQTPPQPSPQGEGDGSKNGEVPTLADNPNWTFVHSNFRYLKNWMDYYGVKEIDGLLADLGVSFHHFDCPERGFSFRFSAPLDMRMNQTAKRTAADIVNSYERKGHRKEYMQGSFTKADFTDRGADQKPHPDPLLKRGRNTHS